MSQSSRRAGRPADNAPTSLGVGRQFLIRAVLGQRVFTLLNWHHRTTTFFAPDDAFADAHKYLPPIFNSRDLDWDVGFAVLDRLPALVQSVDIEVYGAYENAARPRIRDARDWPVLATVLSLNCPIWTEDQDFFGTGVATWTTSTVSLYLSGAS